MSRDKVALPTAAAMIVTRRSDVKTVVEEAGAEEQLQGLHEAEVLVKETLVT
jgi:hypothetical protein